VLTCSENENPDVFAAAPVGLGALGVITAITFAVEPIFLVTAREELMTFDKVISTYDQLVAENEHFEFFWFPHTKYCNTKRNNRSAGPALAENLIRALQAACSYSWRIPPRRWRLRMSRWAIWSRSMIGGGSGRSGRALAMP
jgi:D-arabinono-1,4-lactone oxidase